MHEIYIDRVLLTNNLLVSGSEAMIQNTFFDMLIIILKIISKLSEHFEIAEK
jgi:hypothetical protein